MPSGGCTLWGSRGYVGVALDRLCLPALMLVVVALLEGLMRADFVALPISRGSDRLFVELSTMFGELDEVSEGPAQCINNKIQIALVLIHLAATAFVARGEKWTIAQWWLGLVLEWARILRLHAAMLLLRTVVVTAVTVRHPHKMCDTAEDRATYSSSCSMMGCMDDGFSGHVAFDTLVLLATRRVLMAPAEVRGSRFKRYLVTAVTAVLISTTAAIVVLTRAHWSSACVVAGAAAWLLWRSTGALMPPFAPRVTALVGSGLTDYINRAERRRASV